MRSLRIIIGSLGIGGAERHLCYILPRLHHLYGMSIEVITLSHINDLAEQLEKNGITVKRGHQWFRKEWIPTIVQRGLNLFVNACRLLKEFIYDRNAITHFFLPQSYLMGAIMAKVALLKCPLIMSRRCLNLYQKEHPFFAYLEKYFHSRMSVILGNSQAIVDQLIYAEGCDPLKVGLIYNGIETLPFKNHVNIKEYRQSLKITDDTLVMIMVANMIPYKGHKDMLHALVKFKKQFKQKAWTMIFVGRDDGLKENLAEEATKLGIANNVLFLGQRSDVVELLKIADIGVLSSHQEGFSNAVLESMAAGLPMVVTDVGGNKEAVIDNKNGFVIPPKCPDKMSEALLKLALDKELCESMGKASLERIQKYFSIKACVQKYFELYSKFF